MFKRILFISICLFLITSCEETKNNNNLICTTVFVFGIQVNVKNKTTKEPILEKLDIVITDDDYTETLKQQTGTNLYFGAGERSGRYTITINSDTYNSFTSDEIIVTANECHVIPQTVEVELETKI